MLAGVLSAPGAPSHMRLTTRMTRQVDTVVTPRREIAAPELAVLAPAVEEPSNRNHSLRESSARPRRLARNRQLSHSRLVLASALGSEFEKCITQRGFSQ